MAIVIYLTDIIVSLVSSGIFELIMHGIGKLSPHKRKALITSIKADELIATEVKKQLGNILKQQTFSKDEIWVTMLKIFLESPTAESIERQIFSDFLLHGTSTPKELRDLRKEFQLCLFNHLKGTTFPIDIKQFSDALFDVLTNSSRDVLSKAISIGNLSALDAKEIERFRILFDELKAIQENIKFFTDNSQINVNDIVKFEEMYRNQVAKLTSTVQVPDLFANPRVEIDRIYVAPKLTKKQDTKSPEEIILEFYEFLSSQYRSVILADPGGGKSTLAQYVCYKLSTLYKQRLYGNRLLTPILIILRDLSILKKEKQCSIVEFIESEVKLKFELPAPPRNAIEYLLNNGYLLVIFDGLDELLETYKRKEIINSIEAFCNRFPAVPVLVTSRKVGYEQAPLDSNCFAEYTIHNFDQEQVKDYVTKWFKVSSDFPGYVKERNLNQFIKDSEFVSDLRSNPLMLALMCNLYKGQGYVPRNRPEVYKKCSEMLFEWWDRSRGIKSELKVPEPKFMLNKLANIIYSDEKLQEGVEEEFLQEKVKKYLFPKKINRYEEAEDIAREFIKYCEGRAWVFSEAGSTREGKTLFKFTHKTFLEYYTACDLVRNKNSAKKLWTFLEPKIATRSWDVVAQLSYQLLYEQVEGASDKFMTFLLDKAKTDLENQANYFSFAERCLKFIGLEAKTLQALTEMILLYVFQLQNVSSKDNNAFPKNFDLIDELIKPLNNTMPENQTIIGETILKIVTERIKTKNMNTILNTIVVVLALCDFNKGLYQTEMQECDKGQISYWQNLSEQIFNATHSDLEAIKKDNILIYYFLSKKGNVIYDFLENYPLEDLFLHIPCIVGSNRNYLVFFHLLFNVALYNSWITNDKFESMKDTDKFLINLRKYVLSCRLPCISKKITEQQYFFPILSAPKILTKSWQILKEKTKDNEIFKDLSSKTFFGAWAFWGMLWEFIKVKSRLPTVLYEEIEENDSFIFPFNFLIENPHPTTQLIFSLLKMRNNVTSYNEDELKIQKKINQFKLTPIENQFIIDWIFGKKNLVYKQKSNAT